MGTFLKAKREHRALAKAASENAEVAADLWNSILGIGSAPLPGSFAEAVQDTIPLEHAGLLAMDDVAVAFAFELLWDSARGLPPKATPILPGDTEAVLKMIQHFLGKGTAIGLALGVAVQQVRELTQKGQRGADIILVTDGIDEDEKAQTAALQESQALGARLWTVAIECEISERSPLRAQAAHYICMGRSDLTNGMSVTLLASAA